MNAMWARLRLADELWNVRGKLARKRVVLVGCGSIGAEVAVRLAGCGIERLTLIDGDRVKIHNTPHSAFFCPNDVGKLKVTVVASLLRRKFPSLKRKIRSVPSFVQERSARPDSSFDSCDLVICMVDNDSTRDWVNYHCVTRKRNLIVTGMSGPGMEWGGYLMAIQPGRTACFRCLAGGPVSDLDGKSYEPKKVMFSSDSDARRHQCGIGDNLPVAMISPVVGLISNLTAIAALKMLLSWQNQPNYLYYESRRNLWKSLELKKVEDCPHCGKTSLSLDLASLPKSKLTRIASELQKS